MPFHQLYSPHNANVCDVHLGQTTINNQQSTHKYKQCEHYQKLEICIEIFVHFFNEQREKKLISIKPFIAVNPLEIVALR